MCEALDDHEGNVIIGGRLITNFRFADDIVINAEEEEEAGVMADRLDTTTTRYKMEIFLSFDTASPPREDYVQVGPDKTKVMTNNPNGFLTVVVPYCYLFLLSVFILWFSYYVSDIFCKF